MKFIQNYKNGALGKSKRFEEYNLSKAPVKILMQPIGTYNLKDFSSYKKIAFTIKNEKKTIPNNKSVENIGPGTYNTDPHLNRKKGFLFGK